MELKNKNQINIFNDYAELIIHSEKYGVFRCLLDCEDIEKINKIKWVITSPSNSIFYVYNSKCGYIHRMIMDYKGDMVLDHINGNTLDNRKKNLRLCTHAQNLQNRQNANRTGFKYKTPRNVYFKKQTGRYRVSFNINKKEHHFGYFDTIQEAENVAIQKRLEFMSHATR